MPVGQWLRSHVGLVPNPVSRRSQELHADSETAATMHSAVARITALSSADTVMRLNMKAPKTTPSISPKMGKYLESILAVELRRSLKTLDFFQVPGLERIAFATR